MDIKTLREKSEEELVSLLRTSRKQFMEFRFALASRSLDNTSAVRKERRLIARIMTVLRELSQKGV